MSLGTWLASVVGTGQSPDELKAESNRLDRERDALNARTAERMREGTYRGGDPEFNGDEFANDWLRAQAENNARDTSTYNLDVNGEIDAAFDEGWRDGQRTVTGAVGRFFGGVGDMLSSVLLGIPMWVWLAAAGAVFFYFGGGNLLGRKLRKALA